ncbi:MAG: Holliday junction branch migration protein RuvA [Deltaproteobacteria bacterium]|jgi:Holliday junction DNA helicase RuvA|nr:Holliday junction branch migration protein RuvA [Deltaproteobacteria bacterium]
MLESIRGRILEKRAGQAVIETFGLGLKIRLAIPAFLALPEPPGEAFILTRLIIREESWDIFGFITPAEREAFDILTSVTRVGPRLALSILSSLEPRELAQILLSQDLPSLSRVKGIGLKTAERLLVELRDKAPKLAAMAGELGEIKTEKRSQVLDDALQALVNLGYTRAESEKAIRSLKLDPEADLGVVLKNALKALNL